jgi:RNA polymerase sigma factor (sigma-70 family)
VSEQEPQSQPVRDVPASETAPEQTKRWPHEMELQQAAWQGDQEAFGKLVEYYRPVLVDYAYRMYAQVDNGAFTHRAEDSVQQALLYVLNAVLTKTPDERPMPKLPYFYLSVRSDFLDWLKSASYLRASPVGDLSRGFDAEGAAVYSSTLVDKTSKAIEENSEDTIARAVEVNEARTALVAVWRTLSDRQHQYVYLRFVEGRSLEEISSMTGHSVRAVQAVFSRVFARARKLEAAGEVERPESARGDLIGHRHLDRDGTIE